MCIADVAVVASAPVVQQRCDICGEEFAFRKLFGHHLRYWHGKVSWARLAAIGSQCQACGLQCHSRPRHVRHLARSDECLAWCWTTSKSSMNIFHRAGRLDAEQHRLHRTSGIDPSKFLPAIRL